MKKFSYADEFNRVADVARIGDADDVRVSYSVFVGDLEGEEDSFLDGEFFSADDFTTFSDAAKAKQLVVMVLQQVDKHLATHAPEKNSPDLRRAVLHAVRKALDEAADATKDETDHGLIAAVYFGTTLCAVNAAFAEYRN